MRQTEPENENVNKKLRTVDRRMMENKGEIERLERSNISPASKLKMAELYLQNGEASKAETIVDEIPFSAPEFNSAINLKLEAEVKQNKVNLQTISTERLQSNKRLGAAVLGR